MSPPGFVVLRMYATTTSGRRRARSIQLHVEAGRVTSLARRWYSRDESRDEMSDG